MNLYPLRCEGLTKLVNSHTVAIRTFFEVPRTTHRYIAEGIGGTHMLTKIHSNKIRFYKRLQTNKKMEIVNLFKIVKDDMRSTTGQDC